MSVIQGILAERCPRCRKGQIFRKPLWRGWLAMYDRCPVCHLKFEREPGYFVGAMYVSYGLTLVPMLLLVLAFWRGAGWRYSTALLAAVLVYLPFVPPVVRVSRVVWIYIDQRLDPE